MRSLRTLSTEEEHHHILPMVQAYMELGPLFLEHVAALRNHSGLPAAVLTLAGIMYNYTDERYIRLVDTPEFLALLRCIASLTRRCPLHLPLLFCVQSCWGLSCLIKMHAYDYPNERFIQMVDVLRLPGAAVLHCLAHAQPLCSILVLRDLPQHLDASCTQHHVQCKDACYICLVDKNMWSHCCTFACNYGLP